MAVITAQDLVSLKDRGYINQKNVHCDLPWSLFENLDSINVTSKNYIDLLSSLDKIHLKVLMRYLIINWNIISKKFDDQPFKCILDPYQSIYFFLNDEQKKHRICFFANTIHLYYFG